MPLLDVTQPLNDPDFADTFTVRRRAEVIDAHGWSTQSETLFNSVVGVVTANSPSDLDRREDYQNMTRSISVVTKFMLRGETSGYQPDVVVWRGSNYLVRHTDLYPHFGPGFTQAECTSMDRTDPAVEPNGASPQLAFNVAPNSGYITII